ncbi:hypothetical protein ScPMuIL_017174, partial [Solemya velum]
REREREREREERERESSGREIMFSGGERVSRGGRESSGERERVQRGRGG